MSSIFIDEEKQRELIAGQVATAMVLGNFKDGEPHNAKDYSKLVNSMIEDEKYKGSEGIYKLDENALAKGIEKFSGSGRGGRIESMNVGFEVIEVKNKSKNAVIATPAFGMFKGSTSSFYLKTPAKMTKSRSTSRDNMSEHSESSGSDVELAKIDENINKYKNVLLSKGKEYVVSDISSSYRHDQASLLHDALFRGLNDENKRVRAEENKLGRARARKTYLKVGKKQSKRTRSKVCDFIQASCHPNELETVENRIEFIENIHAIAMDLVEYTVSTMSDYKFTLDNIKKDFDIVAEADEWVTILGDENPDKYDGADNLDDITVVAEANVIQSVLDIDDTANRNSNSGNSNSNSASGGGGGGGGGGASTGNDSSSMSIGSTHEEQQHQQINVSVPIKIENAASMAFSLNQIDGIRTKISKMRQVYSEEQKKQAINLYYKHVEYNKAQHDIYSDRLESSVTAATTAASSDLIEKFQTRVTDPAFSATLTYLINGNKRIFGDLRETQLRDWVTKSIADKLKVNDDYKNQCRPFHRAVWDKLILLSIDEETGEQIVVANITCTYEQVRNAALEVQRSEEFKDNDNINALTFSDDWVCNFITLNDMARRRVSGEVGCKPVATDEKINESLDKARNEMRRLVRKHNLTTLEQILRCTWNFDETGITHRIGIMYGYLPKWGKHKRLKTTAGESNKGRITGLFSVNGWGDMAPAFIIIKHSLSKVIVSGKDKHTVLDTAYKTIFTSEKGWSFKVWTKKNVSYPNKSKKGYETIEVCECKYVVQDGGALGEAWRDAAGNGPSYTVITSQHKAYNDTVRQLMYNELIMDPMRKRMNLPFYIHYQDGCSIHSTGDVVKSFEKLGIFTNTFEPYLTAYIQPLDLIINGLVKTTMRAARVSMRTKAFEKFRVGYKACLDPVAKKKMKFTVPAPRWQDAVKLVINQHNVQFKQEGVRTSLRECFYNVGLTPDETILQCKELSEVGKQEKSRLDALALLAASSTAGVASVADVAQMQEEFYSKSENYVTDAPGAFKQFRLRDHSGDTLSKPMPVTASVSSAVEPGGQQYTMFLGLYDEMYSLKDSLPSYYMKIFKSLAKDYNIPGNLSHTEYCNRLCKLITSVEFNNRVSIMRRSISENKPIVITISHEDDEPVASDDLSDDGDDDDDDVIDEYVDDDDEGGGAAADDDANDGDDDGSDVGDDDEDDE